jgi:GPH family glycoside/pentoside/hexuronide:cation symporter
MAKEKKALGLDSQGIQKTLRFGNYAGDSMGMIALNGISGLVAMLPFFYTDKIGIAAATAGTIMLGARIFDAVTDLGMGYIVDRTKSRFGKARPWIIRMTIPSLVAVVALFCVPANASSTAKNIYAFCTNAFSIAVVYTAIAIPYGCLMAFVTRSTEERSKMGIFRAVAGYIIGMVVAIGLIPMSNALGGDQAAWIKLGIIFGVIIVASLIPAFFANKERYSADENKQEEMISFFTGLKLLFRNKYWVIMLLVQFFIFISYGLGGGAGVYYAKWILKDENLVALLGAVGLIPVVIGFAITGPLIKKFGLAKTTRIALLIGIAATVVRVFFPYSLIATLVLGAFMTFGTIPMMAVGSVLVNNTVEYGEWKTGKRLVGMINSANGFGSKLGNGLGAALIGWVLALGGYNAELAEQGSAAVNSIFALCIWIPGIVMAFVYFLLRFYDLDIQYPQIVKELEERKTKTTEQTV